MPDTSGAGQVRYDCAGCGPVFGAAFAKITTDTGRSARTCLACYTRGLLDEAFRAKVQCAMLAGATLPQVEAAYAKLGLEAPANEQDVLRAIRRMMSMRPRAA